MNTNVDVDAMRKDAVEIFQKGFACSESVIYAIKKGFDLDLSDDAIAMSSGFPWGLGDGGCICGALAGATMCIGSGRADRSYCCPRPLCGNRHQRTDTAYGRYCRG